jgi:hypothetical protein
MISARPLTVTAIAGGAHHGDDLLHGRRVGGIRTPLLRGGRPT